MQLEHPTKDCTPLTPQDLDRAIAHIALGWSLTSAARLLGCARETIYYRMRIDPGFAQAVKDAREEGCDTVEDYVRVYASEKSQFLDRIAYLKAHRREKWGDKQELTSSVNVRIQFVAVPSVGELLAADMRVLQDGEHVGTEEGRGMAGGRTCE